MSRLKRLAGVVDGGFMGQTAHFLEVADTTGSDLATLGRLEQSLRNLDQGSALALVQHARRDGAALESLITGLLAPALVEVGRQWASGEAAAAVALAASTIVRSCIPRASFPPGLVAPNGRTVAVCCAPGEEHEIPAEMVSELLRERGWRSLHLGAGATPAQLPSFLAAQRPLALLISATTPCGLAGAARMIEVAHAEGVPVLVGGAAFGGDTSWASHIGAAGWARSVADAVAMLETWSVNPPLLAPRRLPSAYLLFDECLPEIRSAAIDVAGRLAKEPGRRGSSAVDDRLELVLRYLGAALLVSDGRLFLDFLSTRRAYYEARQIGPERLDGALQAVASALPVELVEARDLLRSGRTHLAASDRIGRDVAPGWTAYRPDNGAGEVSPLHGVAGGDEAGRVFTDLLFVAARSCRAPIALVSLAQPDGRWSTLRHNPDGGATGRPDRVGEEMLFSLVAARSDPMEITDVADHAELASTALAQAPNAFRFAYGVPLRATPQGALLGVLCLLDHRPRSLSVRERQAVAAVARQLTGQLARWRPSDSPVRPAEIVDPYAFAPVAVEGKRMHTHDVAVMFDVTDRTVINWAASNRLPSTRTIGGHLRFRREHVMALLAGQPVAEEGAR